MKGQIIDQQGEEVMIAMRQRVSKASKLKLQIECQLTLLIEAGENICIHTVI
jgi:hypothetical protein